MDKKNSKFDAWSLEYQAAQDSAQHFDTMIWVLVPILFSFSISTLYFAVSEDNITLKLFLFLAGAFSLFYFGMLTEKANEKKRFKYALCKKLEENLKLYGQHSLLEKLPLSGNPRYNGMGILRIARIIVGFLYIFVLIFTLLGWNPIPKEWITGSHGMVVFIIVLLVVILVIERKYSKFDKDQNKIIPKLLKED